jgi:hypothetical protein
VKYISRKSFCVYGDHFKFVSNCVVKYSEMIQGINGLLRLRLHVRAASNSAYSGYAELWILRCLRQDLNPGPSG